MSHTKLVSKVALFNADGQVLILRRSKVDHRRPGGLDFPGGGVEEGESFLQAASRETEEEVGVKVAEKDLSIVYAETNYYDSHSAIRMLSVAKIPNNSQIILSFEHDKYWWQSPSKAIEQFDHPVWSKALAYALEHKLA